ncbi:hypothetical protein pb186bvf_006508 [Paramecium bursaria]
MHNDQDEKEMIGSILDGMFQLFYKDSFESENTPSPQKYPSSPIKVYSPQVKQKSSSYDLDLRLQHFSQKPKSFDQLQQFIPRQDESDLEGDLVLKCKDQNGARNIQRAFQEGSLELKEIIFQKLERGFLQLSKDVFGNYVIQNLLDYGTQDQRLKIIQSLITSMQVLAFNTYGCRVVQKSLQLAQGTQLFSQIFDQIKSKVKELVIDQNGNHVVQKIIQLDGPKFSDWIIEGVQGQVKQLSRNSFGCRIIQKAIQMSKQDRLVYIFDEILAMAQELCISQYGNYIIQELLTQKYIKDQIQSLILSKFEELSINKFGSNVVDKAIQCSENNFKRKIMAKLIRQSQGQIVFVQLSNDPYGNYVVQNFFKQVNQELQKELLLKIKNDQNLLFEIQKSQFGQYVYQMLQNKQDLDTFNL